MDCSKGWGLILCCSSQCLTNDYLTLCLYQENVWNYEWESAEHILYPLLGIVSPSSRVLAVVKKINTVDALSQFS